jgi:DNA-binding CsgD family transcriptional regulator
MTHKVVLDQDSYKQMKAQGKSDAEISRIMELSSPLLLITKRNGLGMLLHQKRIRQLKLLKSKYLK